MPITKDYSGDQIKKNAMGRECSAYGGEESRIHVYDGGNLVERAHLEEVEEVGVDGKLICRSIFRKTDVGAWVRLMCRRIGTGGGHL